MSTSLKAIGAGPFEFPIAGDFDIRHEGGAAVFTSNDEASQFIVGYFRNVAGDGAVHKAEQIARLEALTRTNWERFAAEEKGNVVQPFGVLIPRQA